MTHILSYFSYDHLPAGPLRDTSQKFRDFAFSLDPILPEGSERSVTFRKLLEAKDAAVRAMLDHEDVAGVMG